MNQKQTIKDILAEWKNQVLKVLGKHAYVREIPPNSADGVFIQHFKEDCKIHLAANSCVTYSYLVGVIQLDFAMEIGLKPSDDEGIPLAANWSLCNLLEKVFRKEKSLFCTIILLEGGTVMTGVCTGGRWDEELTNIASATAT